MTADVALSGDIVVSPHGQSWRVERGGDVLQTWLPSFPDPQAAALLRADELARQWRVAIWLHSEGQTILVANYRPHERRGQPRDPDHI
jgi:hypothetical protein